MAFLNPFLTYPPRTCATPLYRVSTTLATAVNYGVFAVRGCPPTGVGMPPDYASTILYSRILFYARSPVSRTRKQPVRLYWKPRILQFKSKSVKSTNTASAHFVPEEEIARNRQPITTTTGAIERRAAPRHPVSAGDEKTIQLCELVKVTSGCVK